MNETDFAGAGRISPDAVCWILAHGCVREREYSRGEIILHQGDVTKFMGVVVRGRVLIRRTDFWGEPSILKAVPSGDVFAETYALCGAPLMIDAVAGATCVCQMVDVDRILNQGRYEAWYPELLRRLIEVSNRANLSLSERAACTAPRTIRGKLLTYLSLQSQSAGKAAFEIPLNREQLADYLGVDRCALSRELGRMRDSGLLRFRKNRFQLLHLAD